MNILVVFGPGNRPVALAVTAQSLHRPILKVHTLISDAYESG